MIIASTCIVFYGWDLGTWQDPNGAENIRIRKMQRCQKSPVGTVWLECWGIYVLLVRSGNASVPEEMSVCHMGTHSAACICSHRFVEAELGFYHSDMCRYHPRGHGKEENRGSPTSRLLQDKPWLLLLYMEAPMHPPHQPVCPSPDGLLMKAIRVNGFTGFWSWTTVLIFHMNIYFWGDIYMRLGLWGIRIFWPHLRKKIGILKQSRSKNKLFIVVDYLIDTVCADAR